MHFDDTNMYEEDKDDDSDDDSNPEKLTLKKLQQ